jgi:SPP1 family phage portal protein
MTTAVVYTSDVYKRPLFAFTSRKLRYPSGQWGTELSVYTTDRYFTVNWGKRTIIKDETNHMGMIPIIEYPANTARMGAFESVIPLLDAINTVGSDRVNDIQQFVWSFMKFINCDIDADGFEEMKKLGAIKIKSTNDGKADVDLITANLEQGDVQTLVDHLYQSALNISGVPNRNGGASTSDTGAAVILRDGWSLAEARAKTTELQFSRSEREFLRAVLVICEGVRGYELNLRVPQIDIRFNRRNFENFQSRVQGLIQMLSSDKIHPETAYARSDVFNDPLDAYNKGIEWYERVNGGTTPTEIIEVENA